MQVVNDREDSCVHHHQFNQGHSLATVELFEIYIEDLCKGFHNDINLYLIENFEGLLILELKVSIILKQEIRKWNQINKIWDDH